MSADLLQVTVVEGQSVVLLVDFKVAGIALGLFVAIIFNVVHESSLEACAAKWTAFNLNG